MSNAKRPGTARKVTTKTEANRRSQMDEGVRLTLDGKTYELRIGDVTPALAREIRRETGRSFMALVSLLGEDPDLDVIQEVIWVARRINGEDIGLDDIEGLDYTSIEDKLDIDVAGPAEVDASNPEA